MYLAMFFLFFLNVCLFYMRREIQTPLEEWDRWILSYTNLYL